MTLYVCIYTVAELCSDGRCCASYSAAPYLGLEGDPRQFALFETKDVRTSRCARAAAITGIPWDDRRIELHGRDERPAHIRAENSLPWTAVAHLPDHRAALADWLRNT